MAKKRDDDDADDAGLDADGLTAMEGEGAQQPTKRPGGGAGSRAVDDRDIDAFMSELADEAEFVQLRRYDNSVSDWVILGKIDAAEATAESISARFGGGKYRARVINSEGIHGKMMTFRLAGKPKSVDDDADSAEVSDLRRQVEELKKAIAEKNATPDSSRDRLMEAVVTRLLAPQQPAVPQRDPLFGDLIQALIAGRPSSSGIDPIELQKLLQEERRSGFEQGKELGEALSISEGGGDGSVASVLAHQLPRLTEIITNAQRAGGGAAPVRRRVQANPPAATQTATALPTTESEPVQTDSPIANYLKPVVPIVLKWARSGKNAEVKAVNMLDDLSESQRETIGGLAESENFVEQVMSAVPALNAPDVREWVTLFLLTVQNTLAPVVEGDDEIEVPEPTTQPTTDATPPTEA